MFLESVYQVDINFTKLVLKLKAYEKEKDKKKEHGSCSEDDNENKIENVCEMMRQCILDKH